VNAMTAATSAAVCIRCLTPAPDGTVQSGIGLLCWQCADLRYDAYLDWYDSR